LSCDSTKSDRAIAARIGHIARLWRAARAEMTPASAALDTERCAIIRRWRERALRAESALTAAKNGGVN